MQTTVPRMRDVRWFRISLVGVLLAGMVTLVGQTSAEAATACPGFTFIGAAGSGEHDDMGKENRELAQELQTALGLQDKPEQFKTVAVKYTAAPVDVLYPNALELSLLAISPYPGVPNLPAFWAAYSKNNLRKYLASISGGVTNSVNLIKKTMGNCLHTKIVLSGYSQGAIVIHQAVNQIAASNPELLGRISGVLLLADGDRVPDSLTKKFGTSKDDAQGIETYFNSANGKGNLNTDIAIPDRTANICDDGDAVCDFSIDTIKNHAAAGKTHTTYLDHHDGLQQATTWMAGVLGASYEITSLSAKITPFDKGRNVLTYTLTATSPTGFHTPDNPNGVYFVIDTGCFTSKTSTTPMLSEEDWTFDGTKRIAGTSTVGVFSETRFVYYDSVLPKFVCRPYAVGLEDSRFNRVASYGSWDLSGPNTNPFSLTFVNSGP